MGVRGFWGHADRAGLVPTQSEVTVGGSRESLGIKRHWESAGLEGPGTRRERRRKRAWRHLWDPMGEG